ncbi:MAG: hypothetical protein ACFB4J_11765 [Elainellaceae cyanobacterium]
MLVVLMENHLVSPKTVCQSCLMADQAGQPRWRNGKLSCGRSLTKDQSDQPDQYECQMGFRIAHIHP